MSYNVKVNIDVFNLNSITFHIKKKSYGNIWQNLEKEDANSRKQR